MDGVRRPETGHGLNDFRVRPGIGVPAPTSPALHLWASYFPSLGPGFFSANLQGEFLSGFLKEFFLIMRSLFRVGEQRETASCFGLLQVHLLNCLPPSRNPWPQDPHNLLLHCRTRETGEAGSGVAGLNQGAGSCDQKG